MQAPRAMEDPLAPISPARTAADRIVNRAKDVARGVLRITSRLILIIFELARQANAKPDGACREVGCEG